VEKEETPAQACEAIVVVPIDEVAAVRAYTPEEERTIARLTSGSLEDSQWLGSAVGELERLRLENARLRRENNRLQKQHDFLDRRCSDLELRLRGVPAS
jgi:hypothetical protein